MGPGRRDPEAARLSYLEDRILSADPVERVCICFEEALFNLERVQATLGRRAASRDRSEQRRLANAAHGNLMRAHGLLGELQAALDLQSEDEEVRRYGQEQYTLYATMLEALLEADRTHDTRVVAKVADICRARLEYWRQVHALFLEEVERQRTTTLRVANG